MFHNSVLPFLFHLLQIPVGRDKPERTISGESQSTVTIHPTKGDAYFPESQSAFPAVKYRAVAAASCVVSTMILSNWGFCMARSVLIEPGCKENTLISGVSDIHGSSTRANAAAADQTNRVSCVQRISQQHALRLHMNYRTVSGSAQQGTRWQQNILESWRGDALCTCRHFF